MSAFWSMISQHEAILLTDGAMWHAESKVLVGAMEKVVCARSVPLAVTSRGQNSVGFIVAQNICDLADKEGVEATVEGLQDLASDLHRNCGAAKASSKQVIEVFVTALLPDGIGVHCGFLNIAQGRCNSDDYIGAYRVWHPPGPSYRGAPEISEAEIAAAGFAQLPSESLADYGRRCGADVFEIMRRKPGPDFDGVAQFWVGGHLDMTIIRPEGCTIERLRTWPDELGRPVDPYSKANRRAGYGQ